MKLNQLDQYELIRDERLPDLDADGYLLRHKKSGARICAISNSDENKVFYIGFRTPPCDNTGTPHIIEHTVLCGSRKFPLKDPFIELVKGSMNTFLNAMTYSDKTVYPVASCNTQDFNNLMDVYLDSVFYPNIYSNENIFRQEGWHYEIDDPSEPLTINGVVYNEMKGALSSADDILEREIFRGLYPDTIYGWESGGDPDEIPELTYEKYLDFHKKYYHPSNSYIYLYGDMDLEERLNWLDEAYLGEFSVQPVDSEIRMQAPFENPKEIRREYSISSSEPVKKNSYLTAAWSIGNNLDPVQYIAAGILDTVLLDRQGAPIKQALIDAGIGDDIYGGYDNGILQPAFSITAKHTDPEQMEEFLAVIEMTLKEQVAKGINKKSLLAAINREEFQYREADFGRIPKGLMKGLQLMDSWLYDETNPFLHLNAGKVYEYLRSQVETDYFEKLTEAYFLANPHRAIIVLTPKVGLNDEKEAALAEKLEAYKASLSPEEIRELIQKTEAVHAFGETPSTKEELETIPLLSREDMKKEAEPFVNEMLSADGVSVLWHNYATSGIVYADFLFDISDLTEEWIPYASMLNGVIGKVDTTEYNYQDLSDEIGLYTGGIGGGISVTDDRKKLNCYYPKYEMRFRVLKDNLDKALSLTRNMLLGSLFDDKKRLSAILAEAKSRMQGDLSSSGNVIGSNRALAYYRPSARYMDMISGISYFKVIEALSGQFDARAEELQEKLRSLQKRIFTRDRLMISLTCGEQEKDAFMAAVSALINALPEGNGCEAYAIEPLGQKNEGFMDSSQVQYVSMVGRYDREKHPYTGAFRIFRSIMSFDYLWNEIRVQGGAYGCGANANSNGDITFSSYRDPNLEETLEAYRDVPEYLRSFDPDERDMTKYVIGTFSELDTPLTPFSKGRRSLNAYLSNTEWEQIQKERTQVLNAQPEDIRALADAVEEAIVQAGYCVVGNESRLKKSESIFGSLIPLSEQA